MDCHEYRAFILNNTLFSLSRSYIDYLTEINHEIITFLNTQIERTIKIPNFPSSYVLDVGTINVNGQKRIDIIEYNSIIFSGLEVSNDLLPYIDPPKSSKVLKKVQ